MDFMVKTAFIIASVHAMAVITLMEGVITYASQVGKELIAVKVSMYIDIYHFFSLLDHMDTLPLPVMDCTF